MPKYKKKLNVDKINIIKVNTKWKPFYFAYYNIQKVKSMAVIRGKIFSDLF